MTLKWKGPAPRSSAVTRPGNWTCSAAMSGSEPNAATLAVQYLQRRFGLSFELAAIVAHLAGFASGRELS